MVFMLDTNACIALIKGRSAKLIKHIQARAVGDVGISAITLAELRHGVEKSRSVKENREALEEFLLPLEIADFDEGAALDYGLVRTSLESAGTPIGPLDTLIGAHARSLGATLVTNNTREFKRIKGLAVADWID